MEKKNVGLDQIQTWHLVRRRLVIETCWVKEWIPRGKHPICSLQAHQRRRRLIPQQDGLAPEPSTDSSTQSLLPGIARHPSEPCPSCTPGTHLTRLLRRLKEVMSIEALVQAMAPSEH